MDKFYAETQGADLPAAVAVFDAATGELSPVGGFPGVAAFESWLLDELGREGLQVTGREFPFPGIGTITVGQGKRQYLVVTMEQLSPGWREVALEGDPPVAAFGLLIGKDGAPCGGYPAGAFISRAELERSALFAQEAIKGFDPAEAYALVMPFTLPKQATVMGTEG